MNRDGGNLAEKIQSLSSEQVAEVEAFVEFLLVRGQDQVLARAATAAREPAFERVWSSPEEDVYDAL